MIEQIPLNPKKINGRIIAIVEDDQWLRKTIEQVMKSFGLNNIASFTDGPSLISWIEQQFNNAPQKREASELILALFVDMHGTRIVDSGNQSLPEKVLGIQDFGNQIQRLTNTSHPSTGSIGLCIVSGADPLIVNETIAQSHQPETQFLYKPFEIEDMRSTLRALIPNEYMGFDSELEQNA